MFGYTFAIIGIVIAIVAIGLALQARSDKRRSREPRLDEKKGTSYAKPIAEQPNPPK